MSESKFATFVSTHKLNPKRIVAASRKIETLRIEDRKIKLAKRRAKSGDAPSDGAKKDFGKPRSGRPITPRAMTLALEGSALTGPQKSRILRAVNHVLEQKKADKIELKTLF